MGVQAGEVKEEYKAELTGSFQSVGARKGLGSILWGAGGGTGSPEADQYRP